RLREVLEIEVMRAKRFEHPLSLIFLDLDHFKRINDGHGHVSGSEMLREVGEILLASVRKIDGAFRYGGDEFALLLLETSTEGAITVSRRIREKFHRKVFLQGRNLSVKMTASFGVAAFPDDASTAADLLH